MVTLFYKISTILNFPLHALCNKNEISQLLTSKFSWILIDHEDHHENYKSEPYRLRRAFLGNSFVCRRVKQGRNSVLQKDCQKLVPSTTYETLKVPLCFICQKNSRDVRITWLNRYFFVTKYEDCLMYVGLKMTSSWNFYRRQLPSGRPDSSQI